MSAPDVTLTAMGHPAPRILPAPAAAPARPRPYTVGEVLSQVRACLEEQFRPVLVVGEVADARRPRGGNLYFTLRDETARLKVMVRGALLERLLDEARASGAALSGRSSAGQALPLQDGDQLLVWGRISAWPRGGDVQLLADRVEPYGEGAERARRELLRRKLEAEGLFATARKRPLPFLPRSVGLVTSPTGAAIRDVLTTLERRFPGLRIVVAPVRVNGREAAPFVAEALRDLDACGRVEVILVVRGGGSREDLLAFDSEGVVRAIAAARTPVVTGIGHETDVTLADLVADRRAPTPTGAAELVVPVRAELLAELARRGKRLDAAAAGRVRQARRRLEMASRAHGLFAPGLLVQRWRERLEAAERRLARVEPGARVRADRARLREAEARLERAARAALVRAGEGLAAGAQRLESLSPLRVLARGYSLTTTAEGAVVREADSLSPGQLVRTRLEQGAFTARVEAVEPGPSGSAVGARP